MRLTTVPMLRHSFFVGGGGVGKAWEVGVGGEYKVL